MRSYKIFLASSSELIDERVAVTAAMAEFAVLHPQYKVMFIPVKWELLASTYIDARKQDEYNSMIQSSDIFILLYWTKVGRYTNEEFDVAAKGLSENGYPKLLLLKKKDGSKAVDSVEKFENKVPNANGQFNASFVDSSELRNVLLHELQKLFKDGYLKTGTAAKLVSQNGPATPSVFLGRGMELNSIRKTLTHKGQLMLINSEGGIGKTTLAAKYWTEHIYDYDHCAWLFCENGIIKALKELAAALQVDLRDLDEETQITALKQSIREVHDNFLLVLDNANDEKEIEKFQREFVGFHWHVLITSRCNGILDKSQELHIEHLPPPLATELFKQNYKEDTQEFETFLSQLLEVLQYHTLCVELFSKNMSFLYERGETLEDFVLTLENDGIFLGKSSSEVVTDYTLNNRSRARTTDDILNRFYDSAKLDDEKVYWLINMALLPAQDYSFRFLVDLFGQNIFEFAELHKLAKMGWLIKSGQFFRISPVIQQLTLAKNEQRLGIAAITLLDRLTVKLANDNYNLVNIDLVDALLYVKPREHLNRSLKKYVHKDLASYNLNAGIYFQIIGDIQNSRDCFNKSQQILERLVENEPENIEWKDKLATTYQRMGSTFERVGELDLSLTYYQSFNGLMKSILKSFPESVELQSGLATSFKRMARIFESKGNNGEAIIYYERDMNLCLNILFNDPQNLVNRNNLAGSYSSLGLIAMKMGDLESAVGYFYKGNNILTQILLEHPENSQSKFSLALSYEHIGNIFFNKLDDQNALLNYQNCKDLVNQLVKNIPKNLAYKNELGISYQNLGNVYLLRNDVENALNNYKDYYFIYKDLCEVSPEDIDFKSGMAIACDKLGDAYKAIQNLDVAKNYYLEGNMLFQEINRSSPSDVKYMFYLVVSFFKTAELQLQNDSDQAIQNYENALSHLIKVFKIDKGFTFQVVVTFSEIILRLKNVSQEKNVIHLSMKGQIETAKLMGIAFLTKFRDIGKLNYNQKLLLIDLTS